MKLLPTLITSFCMIAGIATANVSPESLVKARLTDEVKLELRVEYLDTREICEESSTVRFSYSKEGMFSWYRDRGVIEFTVWRGDHGREVTRVKVIHDEEGKERFFNSKQTGYYDLKVITLEEIGHLWK